MLYTDGRFIYHTPYVRPVDTWSSKEINIDPGMGSTVVYVIRGGSELYGFGSNYENTKRFMTIPALTLDRGMVRMMSRSGFSKFYVIDEKELLADPPDWLEVSLTKAGAYLPHLLINGENVVRKIGSQDGAAVEEAVYDSLPSLDARPQVIGNYFVEANVPTFYKLNATSEVLTPRQMQDIFGTN